MNNNYNNSLKNDIRYKNHETRPDLAGEYLLGDTYQGIAMLIFIGVTVLDYLLTGIPQILQAAIPLWARAPFSAAFFGLGGWLSIYGIKIVFGEYKEEPIFRKEGMFSNVRHPIYLGAILIYLAVLLLTLSMLGAVAWIGIIFLYHWLSKYEESLMLKVFGEDYRRYQQIVPMWLPRIKKK